jgi:AcrR family transcriptional regulator
MTVASVSFIINTYRFNGEGIAISRPHSERRRKDKERKILDAARRVFYRKGFLAVKMQDIIDECGISRGGIYIYFASVDEVFLEVMKQRSKEGITTVNKSVEAQEPFAAVLDAYMAKQKERLVNFENSLFRAYCEYIFSKPKAAVHAFRDTQLSHLRGSVEAILRLGVNQGAIGNERISQLAVHFIAVIDGLSILALGDALTENIVDEQFAILKDSITKGDIIYV